jgi:hypothetical protein
VARSRHGVKVKNRKHPAFSRGMEQHEKAARRRLLNSILMMD